MTGLILLGDTLKGNKLLEDNIALVKTLVTGGGIILVFSSTVLNTLLVSVASASLCMLPGVVLLIRTLLIGTVPSIHSWVVNKLLGVLSVTFE